MSLFRKKPVVIEAHQLPPRGEFTPKVAQTVLDIRAWCGGRLGGHGGLLIPTLEGEMQANPGDWIIRGVAGEFYPCKPAIFDATYEAVEA